MKKGFTLMEILAVLLVIAVVVSMAAPVFRAIRFEVKNSQAKAAASKLAQQMRTYYQISRGRVVGGSFDASDSNVIFTTAACVEPNVTGVPSKKSGEADKVDVKQLFACGYLTGKDFSGLPYTFYLCSPKAGDTQTVTECTNTNATASDATNTPVVVAYGNENAGKKYKSTSGYYIYVDQTYKAKDTDD